MRPFLATASLVILAACSQATPPASASAATANTTETLSQETGAAPEAPVSYDLATLADGLSTAWSMSFLPDGDMLVSEKSGNIRVIRDDRLLPVPVEGMADVFYASQAGLFDVIPHPDFENNSLIYIAYAHGTRGSNATRLSRARFVKTETGGRLEDFEVLFTNSFMKKGALHYGGKIIFLPDGTLMLTVGEGSRYREEAQNRDNHLGTIIRLNADGTVPADNPFVGQTDIEPEIWSYGHRNPQGLAYDPVRDLVYENEHGPRGGDEVNIIRKGANYGWPVITYGIDYTGAVISPFQQRDGMEQSVVHYIPSIATSGLAVYRGDKFPGWEGDLLVGALAGKHVRHIDVAADGGFGAQRELFSELGKRIRDVRVGPDGFVYILTDGNGAEVIRVSPKN